MEIKETKSPTSTIKYPMTYKWPDGMVAIIFSKSGCGFIIKPGSGGGTIGDEAYWDLSKATPYPCTLEFKL